MRVTLTPPGDRDRDSDDDDDIVTTAIARATGAPREAVRWSRSCPTCGSTEHGRPLVSRPRGVAVSMSRAAGVLAVAVLTGTALTDGETSDDVSLGLGVDIESVADVARHDVDAVLVHPLEVAEVGPRRTEGGRIARARLWVAKEAALKAAGIGLRTEPATVRVTAGGPEDPESATTDSGASIRFFAAGDGLAGAVAVVGPGGDAIGGAAGLELELELELF
ncbi:4'-phosphopantetheinyl transferase family protein [Marisediminicola sp. LYQ134]|uniref:4'-phosphopantetheinyl transferase family protein n=1 Tax=unclassified Marisediminicola TaxID=2618316 RepID=UPI0039831C6B